MVSISKKGKIKTKKAGKVLLTAKAGAKTYRIYLSVLNKKHSWRKLSEKKATCTEEGTIKEHLYNTIEKPVTPASEGYAKLWEHLNNQLT